MSTEATKGIWVRTRKILKTYKMELEYWEYLDLKKARLIYCTFDLGIGQSFTI